MRTRTWLLVVVALMPLVHGSRAAEATDSAPLAFEGDVTLPVFPCAPSCGASGAPNETAPLVFRSDVATGAGTQVGLGPAAAVVTSVVARVKFSEPPCVVGESVAGTATGTATIEGANVVGGLLPVTVPFGWHRVGLVAVITSHPLTDTTPAITGAAVFVPTGGAPNCTGGPLTATVAGKAYVCFVTPEGVACLYTRERYVSPPHCER